MSVLLETSLGDLVIDLDVHGSPALVDNFVRLCQARYYTQTLLFRLQAGRCVYGGDPCGDGTGGACAKALEELYSARDDKNNVPPDETAQLKASPHRFLTSQGQRRLTKEECRERGRVVAVELQGVANTVGSQFLITIGEGPEQALDGYAPYGTCTTSSRGWLSLGKVVEDNNHVLEQLERMSRYEMEDRPSSDIRVRRALIVYYAPLEQQQQRQQTRLLWSKTFLEQRGVEVDDDDRVVRSPSPPRPTTEIVAPRIPIEQVQQDLQKNDSDEEDPEERKRRLRAEADADRRFEDKSRARVLEMLGDLPDAEARAPKNVLFVAKLNPITTDEDLQLIFSRFDPNVTVDIIRDHETGQSLQYAFCAFSTEKQALEAYFKMNQALVDDRRILVDFSQSVAHVWDKYRQRFRNMPKAPHSSSGPPARRQGTNDRRHGNGGGSSGPRRHDDRRNNRGWQDEARRGGPRHHGEDDRRRYHHPDERRPVHRHTGDKESDNYHHHGHHDTEQYHREERTTRRERSPSYDSKEERYRKQRRHDRDRDHRREEHSSHRRYDSDEDDIREEQQHHKHRRKDGSSSRRRRHHRDESDEESEESRRRHKKRHKRHRSEKDERRRRERKHDRQSRRRRSDEEDRSYRRERSSSRDYGDRLDRDEKSHRRRRMDSDIED